MTKMRKIFALTAAVLTMSLAAGTVYAEETEAATEAAAAEEAVETEAEAAEEAQAPAEETAAAVQQAEIIAEGLLASDAESLAYYAETMIGTVTNMTDAEMEEILHPTSVLNIPQKGAAASVESWMNIREELGAFQNVKSHNITVNDDAIVVASMCDFANCEGKAVTTISRDDLSMESIVFTEGDQTFGQKMKEAGLNTLIGLGIVFCALAFLSWLISMFKYIAKIEQKAAPKAEAPKAAPAPVVVEEEEEEVDDTELIAVIAAAIAAAEGTTPDGFTVRTIKKHNRNKWQRA